MTRVDQFEFTHEDVAGVANLLASWLASQAAAAQHQATQYVVVETVEIDLEALASAIAGLQDPLGQLRQAIANLLNTVASKIIAALHGVIDAVANAIKSILANIQNIVSKIPEALNAIKDTLQKVVVDPILRALDWVRSTLPKLIDMFKSFAATVQDAIASLARRISDALQPVVKAVSGIIDAVRNAISTAIDAVKNAFSAVLSFIDTIRQRIQDAFAQVVNIASRIGRAIVEGIQAAIQAIQNALRGVTDILGRIPQMIVNAIQGVVNTLQSMFSTLVDAVRGIVDTITSALRGIIDTISNIARTIVDAVSSAFNTIRQAIGGVVSFIQDFARQVVDALSRIPDAISGVLRDIQSAVASALDAIRRGIAAFAERIGEALKPVYDTITSFISRVVDAVRSIPDAIRGALESISRLVGGFVDRVRGALETIASFVSRVIDSIRGFAERLAGMLSDVARRITYFLSTVVDNIRNAVQQIVNAVSGVADAIRSALQNLGETISNLARQFIDAVQSAVKQVADFITSAVDTLRDFIENLPSYAVRAIENVASWIWEHLPDWVKDFLRNAPKAIEAVGKAVTGFINAILKFPEWFPNWFYEHIAKPIVDGLKTLAKAIWENVPEWLRDALEGIAKAIGSIVDTLSDFARDPLGWIKRHFIEPFIDGLKAIGEWIWGAVPDWLRNAFEKIHDFLTEAWDGLVSFFKDPVGTLQKAFEHIGEWIWDKLPDAIKTVFERIREFFEAVWDGLTSFLRDPVGGLRKALEKIGEWVWGAVPDWLRTAFERVKEFLEAVWDGLTSFLKDPVGAISRALEKIGEWIWGAVPDWLRDAFDAIKKALGTIADTLARFAENPIEWIRQHIIEPLVEGFKKIGEWIWGAVPDWIKTTYETISDAFKTIVDTVTKLGDLLKKHIVDPLLQGLPKAFETIKDWLLGGLKAIADAIMSLPDAISKLKDWLYEHVAKPLADAIHDAFKWLWEQVTNAIKHVKDTLTTIIDNASKYLDIMLKIISPAFNMFTTIVEKGLPGMTPQVKDWVKQAIEFVKDVMKLGFTVIEGIREAIERVVAGAAKIIAEPLKEMMAALVKASKTAFEKLRGGEGIDKVYYEFFSAIVPYTMSATAVVEGIRTVGKEVNRIASVMLSAVQFAAAAEGEPLIAFANILEKGAWAVVTEVPFSIAFWLAEPLKKPLEFAVRYAMRNELPIEVPTVTQIRDILRRAMAAGKYEELNKTLIEFIKMRGYSDQIIALMFGGPEVLATTITDRFGGKRLVPLTLLWETPTRTDLVRMLQRDVLQSPMEWARFIAVYGMNEDLGKLYYLASFEYPSFEKLWEFFVRGISGMLWYEPPDFIKRWFAEDAKWLGAGIPVEPKKLNYDYKALFKAIPFYLKWIQKSNFSWFRRGARLRYGDIEIEIDFDWTADSWLMWDIAADLPGKIDARWMAKWGLFDLLSEKAGISIPTVGQAPEAYPEQPFVDLVAKVLEANVASPVVMDLRAFSRLLVANGLHPAWVPITAVAEAINALSDERTLLRTGFINLFKEGFWSIETLDKLLEGFVVASFIVEYFDPTQKKWVAGVINAPVRFLPAERKLLELRALMDRALDILRDASKEALRAFTENVVTTYDEMMGLLNKTIESVNAWFAKEVQAITGKELKLGLDKPYWEAYKTVAEAFKHIFTIRRVRYWVGRILGWLIYRLAYGYVKVEDIKAVAEELAKAARLTDVERSVIERIMERVVGIARREYIPTPAQLATIAEVVPEAIKLAEQVFEARGVPDEWRPIWLKYIENKPIVDEVRRLISTAITYYARGVLTEDEFDKIMEFVKSYGWTDREIEIIRRVAEIRKRYVELREEAKQYIPTPSQLATIAEVVPEAVKYIDEVFKARRVPPEWQPIWRKYVEVKPVYDNVRHMMAAYARALRLGIDLGDLERSIIEIAKWAGWTERELNLLKLWAAVEQVVDEARELRRQYMPTPFALATLAEYVNVPIDLVKKALEARRVPREWMELWLRYIQVRPLADEARQLAYAFFKAKRYGVPLGDLEKTVVEILKQLGFTEQELKLRELRATIEALIDEWREAQRQYIPTPSMLASIAEVVPEARKLLPMVLEARRVPREWVSVWTKYVQLKPIIDEVKALLSAVRRLYEYFAIKTDEFRRWLERLKPWGFEDREIQLILARSEVERALRAWRELAGDVDKMVRLAEYSPKARRVALALVERMIDALPTDPNTKEFLKAMWREYVKVRPVYDEVRRYITELISDYAEGIINDVELRQELEALKEWGIDDYEIEFYIWLAKRRRQRYLARRSRR